MVVALTPWVVGEDRVQEKHPNFPALQSDSAPTTYSIGTGSPSSGMRILKKRIGPVFLLLCKGTPRNTWC